MTPEQTALVEKARASLQAARLLAEEGYFDFAVSRAYYSMFYLAEAVLLEDGLAFSKHSAVIVAFGQSFAKTGRMSQEFHRYLIEGADSRNVGDYDTGPGLAAEDAAEQIRRAEGDAKGAVPFSQRLRRLAPHTSFAPQKLGQSATALSPSAFPLPPSLPHC